MRQLKVILFLVVASLALSACGLLGDDGTGVEIAESVTPEATANVVQAPNAEAPDTDDVLAEEAVPADPALPTAVTLPTTAPTAEPTPDRSQPSTYIVQSGDVLGLIAERFDTDIADLRSANGLDGNLIRVGQELTIPAADGSTTESADAPDPVATSAPASSGGATTASTASVSCNSAATGHCVQPGESLLGIALKYDVTVESLRAANPGISGDLIRSGEVLNLPGGGGTAAPATPSDPAPTNPVAPTDPAAPATPVGAANDADCAARNAEFPFFHAADGLCYANPIGGANQTPIPTVPGGNIDQECQPGFFLWQDGLCYPIPGVTVTATAGPTPTSGAAENYGRPPCRDGYVVLVATNQCWPEGTNLNPTTVTPVPTTATTTTATTTATTTGTTSGSGSLANVDCVGPNFTEDATGSCFLTQEGADANCEVNNQQAQCPS